MEKKMKRLWRKKKNHEEYKKAYEEEIEKIMKTGEIIKKEKMRLWMRERKKYEEE